jgi:hypothetical protein
MPCVVAFGTFLAMGGKSVAVKCNDLKTTTTG